MVTFLSIYLLLSSAQYTFVKLPPPMLSSNVVPVEASEGSVSFLVSFQMAFLTTNLCVMLMRLGIWNTPRVTIAAGHNWK